MNINNLIIEKNQGKTVAECWIDQFRFMIVQALDKSGTHIPDWFKLHRVSHIIDYFIKGNVIKRDNVVYKFKLLSNGELNLSEFRIKNISLAELTQISHILPAPDILKYMSFDVSAPHRGTRNELLDEYSITCNLGEYPLSF